MTKTQEGYLFVLKGLPSKYTWQELKDLIRHVAWTGVRTDMLLAGPRKESTGIGTIKLNRADQASKLYAFLETMYMGGRRPEVTLMDLSTNPATFMGRIAPKDQRGSRPAPSTATPVAYHANQWAPFAVQYTAYPGQIAVQGNVAYSAQQYPVLYSQYAPMTAFPMSYYTFLQPVQAPAAVDRQQYTMSRGGIPINSGHGLARTESREIFISNLDYKLDATDVEDEFDRFGTIEACTLKRDRHGKSSGNATVRYQSAEEAWAAIAGADGRSWMGRKLGVRMSKDQTPVAPPTSSSPSSNGEPVIVNGSSPTSGRTSIASRD